MTKIQSHLETDLKADIVKVVNSQLTRLYNPYKKEPTLVFIRHGVPLLYDGEPTSQNEIYELFNANKDPIVKELSDENFEHLTQGNDSQSTFDIRLA